MQICMIHEDNMLSLDEDDNAVLSAVSFISVPFGDSHTDT